jgi:hypothetical protein
MAGEITESRDWEDNYGVLSPGLSSDMPGDSTHWCVHDAEMAFVCRAATEENALAIAKALTQTQGHGMFRAK